MAPPISHSTGNVAGAIAQPTSSYDARVRQLAEGFFSLLESSRSAQGTGPTDMATLVRRMTMSDVRSAVDLMVPGNTFDNATIEKIATFVRNSVQHTCDVSRAVCRGEEGFPDETPFPQEDIIVVWIRDKDHYKEVLEARSDLCGNCIHTKKGWEHSHWHHMPRCNRTPPPRDLHEIPVVLLSRRNMIFFKCRQPGFHVCRNCVDDGRYNHIYIPATCYNCPVGHIPVVFSDEQTIKNLTTRFKDEESELRNKFHVCRLCITRHRPMRYLPITNPGTVDVGVGYSGIPGHDFTPCTDDADLAFAFLLLEDLERVDASLLSVDVLRNQPHHHQRIVKGRGDAVSFRSYPCTSSFAYRVCPLRRIPEAKGSERKKVHLCPEQCSPCSGERFLDSHVTILWMKDAEAMENMTKRGGISVCRNCMCNLSHEHVQPNVSKSICSARAERVGSAHVIPVALLLEGGDDMDQVLNGDHVVCRRCVHECKDAPRRGLIYIEAPNTCPSYDPEAITILFLANERVRRVMRGGYNCHVCGDCADGIGEHLHYKPEEEERKALRKSKVCDLSSEIVVAFFHESQIGVVTGRGLSPAWIEEEPHLHADPVLGRKKLIPCSGSREEPHIIPDIVPPKAILPAPSVATVPSTASTESTASAGGSGKKTSKVAKGEKRK